MMVSGFKLRLSTSGVYIFFNCEVIVFAEEAAPGGRRSLCKSSESRPSLEFAGQEAQNPGGKRDCSRRHVGPACLCTSLMNLGTKPQGASSTD